MKLEHEYLHQHPGYRFGAGCCWIRIYGGEPGDAPVVICEEMPELSADISEMSGQVAAGVVLEHFPDGLPELPRPLIWIEQRPGRRRRSPGTYYLLTFPTYQPRPAAIGFVRSMTLGAPRREPIAPREVGILLDGVKHVV